MDELEINAILDPAKLSELMQKRVEVEILAAQILALDKMANIISKALRQPKETTIQHFLNSALETASNMSPIEKRLLINNHFGVKND